MEVSKKKAKRYQASDIRRLNSLSNAKSERECRECKRSDRLNDEGLCDICQPLIDISPLVTIDEMYFVVEENQFRNGKYFYLPLPFDKSLTIKTLDQARESSYVRIYSRITHPWELVMRPIYGLVIILLKLITPRIS